LKRHSQDTPGSPEQNCDIGRYSGNGRFGRAHFPETGDGRLHVFDQHAVFAQTQLHWIAIQLSENRALCRQPKWLTNFDTLEVHGK